MSNSKVEPPAATTPPTPGADSAQPVPRQKAVEIKPDEAKGVAAKPGPSFPLKAIQGLAVLVKLLRENLEGVPPPPQTSNAAPNQSIPPPSTAAIKSDETKSREVRLGLVLYGGVSLAIYMNGVANEFFRAVRGRGIYQLIKILTDSDIVVDIVSGTSAGGINGIFLAYALCNQLEFPHFAHLWREHGDVSKLLRDPTADDSHSLFDSKGYFQLELERAFRRVYTEGQIQVGKVQEEVSAVPELDLFVTGTDVEGKVYTTFDDLGHAIDVKDHRTLFQLKHRHHRKEPFNPTFDPTGKGSPNGEATYESLATLARITSCFPAAFEPVEIRWGGKELDLSTAAGRLQEWGLLRQDEFFEAATNKYFVDGGVLNNKPFTSTLDAIFHRMAMPEVERFLMYVEPDPERFAAPVQPVNEPTFSGTILDSLISLPGYQSIAADLKAVAEHNTKVDLYNRLTQQFRDEMSLYRAETSEALKRPGLHALHVRSRLVALSARALQGVLKKDGIDQPLEPAEKDAATQLFRQFDNYMRDLRGSNQDALLKKFDVYFRMRRLFYVVYRLRSLLYPREEEKALASQRELDAIEAAKDKKTAGLYEVLNYVLNRQIELVEIVQTAMEDLIDRAPIPWHEDAQGTLRLVKPDRVWELASALLSRLLDSIEIWPKIEAAVKKKAQAANNDPGVDALNYVECWKEGSEWKDYGLSELKPRWLTQRWLSEFKDVLDTRTKTLIDELNDKRPIAPAAPGPNLLADIDACNARITDLLPEDDPVRRAYDNFDLADSVLYPLEIAADLRAKDRINIVRISPLDANKGLSNRPMDEKVTGVQFYHFGAFFKRSWRSNDILWGRLDAASQLVETLLTRKRLERVVNDDDLRAKIHRRLGFEPHIEGEPDPVTLDQIFPHLVGEPKHDLEDWLERVLSNTDSVRDNAMGELEGQQGGSEQSWQTRLIQAEQHEIINQDLEGVIRDAAEEQLEWNQFRTSKKPITKVIQEKDTTLSFDARQFEFKGGSGDLDTTVIGVTSAKVAREAAERIPDKNQFFLQEYSVGLQRLIADVPTVILLEIVSKALLVLRNCILTNLGEGAQKVKAATSFKYMVDWPLRIFYYYVRWWRQAPAAHRYAQATVFSLACVLLAMGYWWRNLLFSRGFDGFGWIMAVSVAVLLIIGAAFWSGASWRIRYWWLELIPVAAAGIAGYIWRDTLILSLKAVGQALSHVWPRLSHGVGVVIVLLGLIGVAFVAGLIVEAERQRRNSVAELLQALKQLPRTKLLDLTRRAGSPAGTARPGP